MTSCIQCKKGYTSKEGASSCDGCDVGKYGSKTGTCSPCPPGQYQDSKSETACKECDVDTYLNEPGKSSKADCTPCSADRSTGKAKGNTDASACLCKRTDYYQNEKNDCEICPPGADCSAQDGITLSQLTALPEFWRANTITTLFTDCKTAFSSSLDPPFKAKERCPGGSNNTVNTSSTAFDPNSLCSYSYGGPSCMSCLNNDYTMSNNKCTKCKYTGFSFELLSIRSPSHKTFKKMTFTNIARTNT